MLAACNRCRAASCRFTLRNAPVNAKNSSAGAVDTPKYRCKVRNDFNHRCVVAMRQLWKGCTII